MPLKEPTSVRQSMTSCSSYTTHLKRSEKKWSGLTEVSKIFDDNVLKLSKSQGTRWIGHRVKALKVLDRNYRSLRLLFEDMGSGERADIRGEDSAKIRGYLQRFKSLKFVLLMSAYLDITLRSYRQSSRKKMSLLLVCILQLKWLLFLSEDCLILLVIILRGSRLR